MTFCWCIKLSFGDTSVTNLALKNIYLSGTLYSVELKDGKSDLAAL